METNGKLQAMRTSSTTDFPIIEKSVQPCNFTGYEAGALMKETSKLRKLITKKGTLEI